MNKAPEELYQERIKRIEDATQLKTPDRVPVVLELGLFPAKYIGITGKEYFHDSKKRTLANKTMLLDFQPDMYFIGGFAPGPPLGILDCKQVKIPGNGVPPDHCHQFVEGEYMKADEYDDFLDDPSNYAIKTYLPRIFGILEPLKMLPNLSSMNIGCFSPLASIAILATPEFVTLYDSLLKAGQEMLKWRAAISSFVEEMTAMGFPHISSSGTGVPFDRISDFLRGMRGSMLDMYRQPDKLLSACDKILPMMIQMATNSIKKEGNPRLFIALHRGADGFMSLKQFDTFYWPYLKKLLLAIIEEGLTPCVFFEGDYTSRLEYLLQLPKGKIIGHFDTTDIFRAKEVLKDHMCIRGNIPSSLLQTGTTQDVKDYCKQLIDVVGNGGGFIMSPRSSIDEAKTENVKAMVDFTKEYGVYK